MDPEVGSIEQLSEVINSDGFTCVVVWANFKKGSEKLVANIKGCSSLMSNSQLKFVSLCIDDDEENDGDSAEDIALFLNKKFAAQSRDIPSINVYKSGSWVKSITNIDLKTSDCDFIAIPLAELISRNGKSGCCGPSSSGCSSGDQSKACCSIPGGGSAADQLAYVTQSYAATVRGQSSCCVSVDSSLNGYTANELILAGSANLGVGCGNPLTIANLQKGERVLDLGSGAGIDCFLAGERVGPTGSVIGVDMTPAMVHQARTAATERRSKGGAVAAAAAQVSFRLGEIEHLPLADSCVDAVLSNCVINLSPDKGQVMEEMFRVLAPGGRVAVSDVLLREQDGSEDGAMALPEHLRTMESLAC